MESAQTMDSTLLAVFKKTCALTIYSPDGAYYRAFNASGCPNQTPNDDIVAVWKGMSDHGLRDMYAVCNGTATGQYLPGTSNYTACCGGVNCTMSSLVCKYQDDWNDFKHGPAGRCLGADSNNIITDSPFGSDYVISLGYLIVFIVTIPVGFYDLESNMWVQVGGFLLLVYCFLAWMVQFFVIGLDSKNMPLVVSGGTGGVLSDVMFNFGFVVTIPSWLNEKQRHVRVAKSVWYSVAIGGVMFLGLGLIGGVSNIDFSNQDLLAAVTTNPNAGMYSTAAAYIFPPAALLTGIPVFSIIIRYNLVESKICNKFWANLFAVVFPWIASLFFYTGDFLNSLINWSSAILFVLLNFVFPLVVYVCMRTQPDLINQDDREMPGSFMGELKEIITIIPYGWEWMCCKLREFQVAVVMVAIGVILAVVTLILQIVYPA